MTNRPTTAVMSRRNLLSLLDAPMEGRGIRVPPREVNDHEARIRALELRAEQSPAEMPAPRPAPMEQNRSREEGEDGGWMRRLMRRMSD
jgi:hypothetical protein